MAAFEVSRPRHTYWYAPDFDVSLRQPRFLAILFSTPAWPCACRRQRAQAPYTGDMTRLAGGCSKWQCLPRIRATKSVGRPMPP
jgi:hypothetical protein